MPYVVRGGTEVKTEPRRLRIQVYFDVLRSLHAFSKRGSHVALWRIERASGVTHMRLKQIIQELTDFGMLTNGAEITARGYTFLEDINRRVAPVLLKYGFWTE
jgi:predicted transcriptional regulator